MLVRAYVNPVLSIEDVTVEENAGNATFTVTRKGATNQAVTVDWETSDGTATAGSDYTSSDGTLTFASGKGTLTETFTVPITDDTLHDPDETFTVTLSNATPSTKTLIETETATATITDNDSVGVLVTEATDLRTTEAGGTATFNVALGVAPTADVSVALASSDTSEGTVAPPTLTFTTTNWGTVQTVTVTGVDDSDLDGDVSYNITFTVTSPDSDWDGLTVAAVAVSNADDEMNAAPMFEADTATRSVAENTGRNQDIGAPVSATDADGDTLTYSLSGADAIHFGIDGTDGQLETRAALDYETKRSYLVTVGVSDGKAQDGTDDPAVDDTIDVTITVTDVAEGAVIAPQPQVDVPADWSLKPPGVPARAGSGWSS